MLVNVDYTKTGSLIDQILDIVEPIPEGVSDSERERLDEWRQMYVMSSHFSQWKSETLQKFLDRIKKQKEKGEKVDYMNFPNL